MVFERQQTNVVHWWFVLFVLMLHTSLCLRRINCTTMSLTLQATYKLSDYWLYQKLCSPYKVMCIKQTSRHKHSLRISLNLNRQTSSGNLFSQERLHNITATKDNRDADIYSHY